MNGSVAWEGRVEVRNRSVSDTWGTVCHDLWGDQDAAVVCRQLGFGNKGKVSVHLIILYSSLSFSSTCLTGIACISAWP